MLGWTGIDRSYHQKVYERNHKLQNCRIKSRQDNTTEEET